MKKSFIISAIALLISFNSHAQSGIGIGGGISIPVFEASDVSSFGFRLDANFLAEVSSGIYLGGATGFANMFGKEEKFPLVTIDHDDFQYIPVAVAARYKLSSEIEIGGDMGYAIAVSDNWDGGFYYRPIFGYNVSDNFQVNMSFTGVSDSWITWSTFDIGILFRP